MIGDGDIYGLCLTACNAGAVTCYASFGYVFGTVTAGSGMPASIATCNSILSTCMSTCAASFLQGGSIFGEESVNEVMSWALLS